MIYWCLSGFIQNSTSFISTAGPEFMKNINKVGREVDTVSFVPYYITGIKRCLSVIHLFLLFLYSQQQ